VVGEVAQELVKATILKDAKDARNEIVKGTRQAIRNSESPLAVPAAQIGMSLGSIGSNAGSLLKDGFKYLDEAAQVRWFQGREPFIQTPEQKLANHVALLQDRSRRNAKELADIDREAVWVRSNPKADADSKALARYVQGLALRNLEKFAEAKKAFEDTLTAIPKVPGAGTWHKLAHDSHRELVDPNEYYVKQIKGFLAASNANAALGEASLGLKAIPGNALLYSQRAMIRYEMIRGKGPKAAKLAEGDIRADAAGAAADAKLKAEAKFIEGLLEEELGNLDVAEKLYKDAIDMHQGDPDGAARYRVARARLLLRDRTQTAPAAAPAPADDEKKKKEEKVGVAPFTGATNVAGSLGRGEERTIVLHPWSTLVAAASVGQGKQIDELEDKETLLRLNETLKLADELIKSNNDKIKGQGYLLRGSAISKMGKRTEGLREYAKGLKMVYPNIETKELQQLIDDHPAFQQLDTSEPNPIIAERFFGEGIHFYWAKKYPEAEAQFAQAIRYFEHDPRYQYYLGLAQLQQKTLVKRDAAIHSFEKGARLEVKLAVTNPDTVRDVNASLERIQGELRQTLNKHRYKITHPEPEK
ncbi:MAG: tetratricopeptide repeat protein, partial [Planctomycetes bacterium]|nr:tetratricopeptide repeat protein [Planctomycetota bacterium]